MLLVSDTCENLKKLVNSATFQSLVNRNNVKQDIHLLECISEQMTKPRASSFQMSIAYLYKI